MSSSQVAIKAENVRQLLAVLSFGSGEPILDAKIHVKDGFNGSGPFIDSNFTTDAEALV